MQSGMGVGTSIEPQSYPRKEPCTPIASQTITTSALVLCAHCQRIFSPGGRLPGLNGRPCALPLTYRVCSLCQDKCLPAACALPSHLPFLLLQVSLPTPTFSKTVPLRSTRKARSLSTWCVEFRERAQLLVGSTTQPLL